jgi:lysozyme family protein
MADFEPADKMTSQDEGGWGNNPDDDGAETWRGISRKRHPDFPGWPIIDQIKKQKLTCSQPPFGTPAYKSWVKLLNSYLSADPRLEKMRGDFYRANFWNRLGGLRSQDVANYVYNIDVVSGSIGSRILQTVLAVAVDGSVGSKTIAAANAVDSAELLRRFKAGAVDFFVALAHDGKHDGADKSFERSWLSRLDLPADQYQAALQRALA